MFQKLFILLLSLSAAAQAADLVPVPPEQRADIEQPDTVLHPGQSVKVRILGQTGQDATLHVPASSLVWVTDKAYVFVETAEGFTPTPVKALNQTGEDASITGVAPDSKVAAKGVAALKAKWQEGGE